MTLLIGKPSLRIRREFGIRSSEFGVSQTNSAPRTPNSALGMTLVELLVILAIIGVIVGMSVPALTSFAQGVRLKATTRQMVGLISLARSMAISSHEEHMVVIDLETQQIRVVNRVSGEVFERVLQLPPSISVEVKVGGKPSGDTKIVFNPTGSLAGRTTSLTISDQKKQQVVTVTGSTGAIGVQ